MHEWNSSKGHEHMTGGFDSRDTPSRDTMPTYGFVWVRSAIYEVADVSETLCGDYSFNGVT